jgi:hypothetical protein
VGEDPVGPAAGRFVGGGHPRSVDHLRRPVGRRAMLRRERLALPVTADESQSKEIAHK